MRTWGTRALFKFQTNEPSAVAKHSIGWKTHQPTDHLNSPRWMHAAFILNPLFLPRASKTGNTEKQS